MLSSAPVIQIHVPQPQLKSTQQKQKQQNQLEPLTEHHQVNTNTTPSKNTNSSHGASPIFGVGVGILLDQTPPTGQPRNIFQRQKSEEADRKRRMTMPLIYRMYESQSDDLCGTVRGPDDEDFRPEEASKQLRESLARGIQSHDQILIDVLLAHNNFQRQKIANTYGDMFGRVLIDDIQEESGGHFADSILALLTPAHVYSARLLYAAISGKSIGRTVAVEIGLTTTAPQLNVIRDTYQTEFRISLERDLNMKVEGLFGKILTQLLLRREEFKSESDEQEASACQEADLLYQQGTVEELGRSLELFNRIFGSRSPNYIRTFVQRFDQQAREEAQFAKETRGNVQTGESRGKPTTSSFGQETTRCRDFESCIRKSVNIHSDVKQTILLYVRISKNMQLYFAERLHEAVFQNRPDHTTIIRILVSRSEIDLYDICTEYKKHYGHNLTFDLQNMCSGDFLRLLNQLINPSDVASGDQSCS